MILETIKNAPTTSSRYNDTKNKCGILILGLSYNEEDDRIVYVNYLSDKYPHRVTFTIRVEIFIGAVKSGRFVLTEKG